LANYSNIIKRLETALVELRDVSATVERNKSSSERPISNHDVKTAVGKIRTADQAVELALLILTSGPQLVS
jgi:hypothetical protein